MGFPPCLMGFLNNGSDFVWFGLKCLWEDLVVVSAICQLDTLCVWLFYEKKKNHFLIY